MNVLHPPSSMKPSGSPAWRQLHPPSTPAGFWAFLAAFSLPTASLPTTLSTKPQASEQDVKRLEKEQGTRMLMVQG